MISDGAQDKSWRRASIAVLTATYNSEVQLPALIDSLRKQTCAEFDWVVVDGASSDRTVELVRESGLKVTWLSEPDFGIYDALNNGLRQLVKADYYLVVGSDDKLAPDCIENYQREATNGWPEVVSARVETPLGTMLPGRGQPWRRGQLAFVSQHSVGTLLRTDLHNKLGYYSRRYPIAADQHFVLRACLSGRNIRFAKFTAGWYSETGISNRDTLGCLTEYYRVQVEVLGQPLLQTALFVWRLAGRLSRVVRDTRRMVRAKGATVQ